MARRFLTSIDLSLFELQNAKIHVLSSDPTGLVSGDEGLVWYNSSSNRLKVWDGSGAGLVASDSALLEGEDGDHYLARANHNGTQTAATISDLAATVKAYTLDEFADAAAAIGLGGFKITALADGTADTDAATFGQLRALAQGHDYKDSVRAATTEAGTLATDFANGSEIDNVTLATGNRILIKDQVDPEENGIYVVPASGAPARAADADAVGELSGGTVVAVEEGDDNGDLLFMLTTNGPVTPGTTEQAWATYGANTGEVITAGAGLTKTLTTLDVGAGNGITVAADSVAVDPAVVARKVSGVIPTSTTGIYTVSGAAVTINHGLNNFSPWVSVRYYTSPGAGNTQGDPVFVTENCADADNVTLTFPAGPSSNQYHVSVLG